MNDAPQAGYDPNDPNTWIDPPPGTEKGQRQNGPDHSAQFGRILSGAKFIARHVPPVWLIDGIVQRGRLYACTSLTGHGKTAVWLYNGCMIHAGRMIGQLDVFQGNVLFLAGENPADLEARMIGMARTFKLAIGQLPYVLPGSFPLTEQEADTLKRDIAGLGVPLALIVGDTASSFFPGDDENSNTQAGTYARTLRGFNECEGHPAVVVLSHPVKNASRGNLLPRGVGAFLNELDGNLANWSDSLGEVTELHWCGKIRGPDFSPFGYRLRTVPTGLTDEKNRPEMTIIAEPMSEEAVADHSKQTLANEDVVLRALRDHPDWSFARLAREAGWLDENDQPLRPRVQRAIRCLADDKLVVQLRKGAKWTLTAKGEEALHEDNQ
jgi:AAA domain